MHYRKLGKANWDVSEIGFGGWALGGQWGGQDDNDSTAALNKAIDLGLNFIDTAEGYGDGRSERVIARVLRRRSERVYVATKTPPAPGPWPPSPYCTVEDRYPESYLRKNVEQRLKNLGVDCLDVLQLHTWTRAFNRNPASQGDSPIFADTKIGTVPCDTKIGTVPWNPAPLEILRRLRDEGKLRLIGISAPEQDQNCVIDLMRRGYIDVVQIIYNLFEQEPAAELLPAAKETGTGVIVRVVFDEGVLTGKYAKGHKFPENDFRSEYFAGDRLDRAVERVEQIRADLSEAGLAGKYTLADVAMKFALAHPAVSTVIPGIRNARQAEQNLGVSDKADLPAALLEKLRRHNWLRGVWY